MSQYTDNHDDDARLKTSRQEKNSRVTFSTYLIAAGTFVKVSCTSVIIATTELLYEFQGLVSDCANRRNRKCGRDLCVDVYPDDGGHDVTDQEIFNCKPSYGTLFYDCELFHPHANDYGAKKLNFKILLAIFSLSFPFLNKRVVFN